MLLFTIIMIMLNKSSERKGTHSKNDMKKQEKKLL